MNPEIAEIINQILALLKKLQDKIQDSNPSRLSRIEDLAKAIQRHEGWFLGSRSQRNNNPGNVRFVGQKGAVNDGENYAKWQTFQEGWNYLIWMLTRAAKGESQIYRPEMTLYNFFRVFAPSRDNNNPELYAEIVAQELKVDPQKIQIKDLL